MAFAIKAELPDPREDLRLRRAEDDYGGRHIAAGDTIFVFASESEGGQGLVARDVVTAAEAVAKRPGIIRQTPRVSIAIRRTAFATRALGRGEFRHLTDWHRSQPGAACNNR